MDLIVDTNSILAALIKDSTARKIVFKSRFKFYAPEIIIKEIFSHIELISSKTGFEEFEVRTLAHFITSYFTAVPLSKYEDLIPQAQNLISHPNDFQFIALALAIPNDGIWTADKHFEEQNKIKIWKTGDLLKLLPQSA